jgi:hypothetical protein
VSLRRDLKSLTNFSSVSNASSNGNVICAELSRASAGAADAVGVGAVFTFAVFELIGADVQLVNKQIETVSIESRPIIFGSSLL